MHYLQMCKNLSSQPKLFLYDMYQYNAIHVGASSACDKGLSRFVVSQPGGYSIASFRNPPFLVTL